MGVKDVTMLNVQEILIEVLKANGFDGLCYDECGCLLADLAPCCCIHPDCWPGYRIDMAPGRWCVVPEKPQPAKE
jgi:hypothetical protein